MALVWKPFHHTASVTARVDGRGYYIHRVGGLFELVVVPVASDPVKLGTFSETVAAKAAAEKDVIEMRRRDHDRQLWKRPPAPAASTRRLATGQPKAHE